MNVVLPQFREARDARDVVHLQEIRSGVGNHVVVRDDVETEPALNRPRVRHQFGVEWHELGLGSVYRFQPAGTPETNLSDPVTKDHDPDGLALDVWLK